MSFHNEKSEPLNIVHDEAIGNVVNIEPAPEDDAGTNFTWDIEVILNLLACFLTYFTAVFSVVVPSGAIPFISRAFPEETSNRIWISASFTAASCSVQAFCGDLSDRLGRKIPILTGMLLGIAGTLLSGRASNLNMVIAGQALSGAGSTLGFLCIPLFQEIVPKSKRPMIMAVAGIFPGTAYSSGSIISGAFIKGEVGGPNDGWRCGFYLCAGCYAIALLLIAVFYHPSPRPNPDNLPMARRILQIDWLGVFLVTAGLVLFLVGLESGGNPSPWSSTRVVACLVVGAGIMAAFCLWEWKGTKDPILGHDLFEHRNFAVTLAICFVGGMVLFGGQAFLPQEVVYLFTDDAVLTGVWGLPFNFGTVIGAMVGGIWLAHSKEAKPIVFFTFLLLLLGAGLMLVVKPGVNFAAWLFSTGLLGAGVGIQTTVLQVIVTLCTPDHLIAAAASVSNAVRALGGSIGVVIFSQVLAAKAKTLVPDEIAKRVVEVGLPLSSVPAFVGAILTQDTSQIAQIPGVTPEILAAAAAATRWGYSASFKYVWYSLIPFAVVCMGLSLLLKPTGAQMTDTVSAGIQRRNEPKNQAKQDD
ncbi:uncharacterized protein Z518_01793 [Rhinocladiella mackenziei CBS 650.93]|uniref:Major facilitator superfamily (MFS) profile domain-containing protein n=1 Tax=Rhinocladiella mackenziei CBS 650.93 TaxID=1442369 RepID=A0A0D2IXE7_9EURO|nr:uncharacterized protein Z518_01793 [Rhinocladiella mackenziei CBS 650.93]KIX10709.1 hypothetical protein Z518_01793 [Rhinocladiella mackenziei CBS 650.93]